MSTVLVTGASGLVGRAAVPALVERGYEVHAVTRRARPVPPDLSQGGGAGGVDERVVWHQQVDLLDAAQTTALTERVRPSHLLHLAWEVTPGAFWTSPLNRRWLDASLTLLEAFGAAGGQRAVMVGTCAEYAPPPDGRCVEGTTPIAPSTAYGACKGALGIMLPAFARQSGVASTAWARLFYLYGPGEPPARLVPSAILSLLRDASMPCTHGQQVRDFLYVEDAAEALVALLDSAVTGSVNVASGRPTTLRALLSTIGAQLGREHLLQVGARPAAPDEPPVLVADVTRLTREVGWTPRTSLDDGVRQTIAWWQGEGAPWRREGGQ
jgi:nucleoside-diphosphate-sugar epimerase